MAASKWLVIIFAILWIVGLVVFFTIPFTVTDIDTFFLVTTTSFVLIGVGFFGFFISLLYWIFVGRKKVGA
ncbi:MAG: hypothetical protein ACE5I4_00515 [Thermoplasmata archaeon]